MLLKLSLPPLSWRARLATLAPAPAMADATPNDTQQQLAQLWLKEGRKGSLAPWSEAKAWALREAWKLQKGDSTYGLLEFVSKRVVKQGGGNPSASAISLLFDKMDDDPAWFPGKTYGERGAPSPALSGPNKAIIARSATALKREGLEPTFSLVVAQCPKATVNPNTEKTVDKKRIYAIMRQQCYDESPEQPWTHRPRLSKTILTEEEMARRLQWGHFIQGLGHTSVWYENSLVWTDICNDILPRTAKRATQQAQARKRGRGWMSEGSQAKSANLRGPKESLKQNSWDSQRLWWAPVLLRGKVHVEVLGCEFPGESPEGAAILVGKVRAAINKRCQSTSQPKTVFVDRGRGFYDPRTGRITDEFKEALREHGLQAFMGHDASRQPGSLQEIMLHETVVAWVRGRMAVTCPRRPWEETAEAHAKRLRGTFEYINKNYDVEGLSQESPARVQSVIDGGGGKLSK